jgi:hypothetical protein
MDVLGTGVLNLCFPPKKYECTWNWCFEPVFSPQKNMNVLGAGVLNLCLPPKQYECIWNWCFEPVFTPQKNINVLGTGVHQWLLHIPDLDYI